MDSLTFLFEKPKNEAQEVIRKEFVRTYEGLCLEEFLLVAKQEMHLFK